MARIKIRRVGNSLGVILPAEILQRLDLNEGDEVLVTVDHEGIRISAFDPDFGRAMEVFEEGCKEYRNALRKLAE